MDIQGLTDFKEQLQLISDYISDQKIRLQDRLPDEIDIISVLDSYNKEINEILTKLIDFNEKYKQIQPMLISIHYNKSGFIPDENMREIIKIVYNNITFSK